MVAYEPGAVPGTDDSGIKVIACNKGWQTYSLLTPRVPRHESKAPLGELLKDRLMLTADTLVRTASVAKRKIAAPGRTGSSACSSRGLQLRTRVTVDRLC